VDREQASPSRDLSLLCLAQERIYRLRGYLIGPSAGRRQGTGGDRLVIGIENLIKLQELIILLTFI
jgi:hypothetical protein